MAKIYCLLGSDTGQCRVIKNDNSLPRLRSYGATLAHYAIYHNMVNGRNFHNSTDEKFLVEYHNDPYWQNRGDQKDKEK